jgi:P4 family phage/plasmid primase-like protien
VESAISEHVAAARGYESLEDTPENRGRLLELGFARPAWDRDEAWPVLLIPVRRATGEIITHQMKAATPRMVAKNGKSRPVKYETPKGGGLHLDVPEYTRQHLAKPGTPLWFTEGVKKVDSMASRGLAAIGLTGVWCWRSTLGTLGDWEDVPLKGRKTVVVCFDADAATNPAVRAAMRRFGAWLKSKGVQSVKYVIVPSEVNGVTVKGVDDYFAAGGDAKGLADVATDRAPDDGPRDAAFSDTFLAADLVADELDGRFRYVEGGIGWLRWTGTVWEAASERHVSQLVQDWATDKYHAALDAEKKEHGRHGAEINGWRTALGASKQASIIKQASARPGVLTDANDLDADPDLLNCPNGIVDLRTGVLTPHDPDKLMTKITGVEYRQGYTHPDWDKALEALPEDVRGWYQLRKGQAITGHMVPDDLVVICQGGGSNGKTTCADTLVAAAGKRGGYYVKVAHRALLGNASENHPTEMMDFMGARIAVLEETPEAKRLDVNRVKQLAGTDQITARKMRQDSVTFDATHSLFINTNHKPLVDETDHGTWRRLALLVFPYTYRKPGEPCTGPNDRPGDPTLRERCKHHEGPRMAALAWMVEGARKWYAADKVMPPVPERVEQDTEEWRMDTDLVLKFIREHLEVDPNAHVWGDELRGEFNSWLAHQGHREWTEKTLVSRFLGHDECSRNGVDKKRLRKGTKGLSRPFDTEDPFDGITRPEPGGQYTAWLGFRFKRPDARPKVVSPARESVPTRA